MDHPATVFIADDHAVFLDDVKGLIARNDDLRLVGEATDGHSAWEQIVNLEPALVLLDISMPGLSGLEVAERIGRAKLSIKIIFVTGHKEEGLFNGAMDLGINGYVLKDDYVTDLPRALKNISQCESFLSPGLIPFLRNRERRHASPSSANAALDDLTPKELRILRLLAECLPDKAIAKELSLPLETVIKLQQKMRHQFGLKEENELVAFALEHRDELKQFKLIPRDLE